ncbi:hypothetical protein GMDG_07440 [Pseudogymnoascus destructans 20631-21]|uniref:Uncharacterized protein n=1 Tax=Pseudogymnoascus destructans (strain ATCC MYA-4855 / 20631-21) TaxID=658429 RepID=L8FYG1_PSED2|nr:hypothetical protein GMDG_07440 [Pseudogymnoascus destructans 20631-21]
MPTSTFTFLLLPGSPCPVLCLYWHLGCTRLSRTGTPGNVRLEHPQEIAGFYIQAAGENVAQVSQVRSMGCEQCDAAYVEEGSQQVPFFAYPLGMCRVVPVLPVS